PAPEGRRTAPASAAGGGRCGGSWSWHRSRPGTEPSYPAPMGTRLAGCTVVSLRPVGGHAPLRRAAAAEGARLLALSPWRLVARTGPEVDAALSSALQAARVVFTSPAAV